MKLAMMQLNPKVGDVKGNLKKALSELQKIHNKCDIAVFSELYLTGYPPRDLLERRCFIDATEKALLSLVKASSGLDCALLVGAPLREGDRPSKLYNSAVLIEGGRILANVRKSLLPSYDVFDETRYFTASEKREVVSFKGRKIAITLCEDMWTDQKLWPEHPYTIDPVSELSRSGADMNINLAASPFHVGKEEFRYRLLRSHALRSGRPFVFVNQVGGNDELVFDGSSLAVDGKGRVTAAAASFREEVLIVDTESSGRDEFAPPDKISSIHSALVLGLSDYMRKCGFEKALLGLSGGIDSAVCLALAVEAAGREKVTAISLPSEYSHPDSERLARDMARRLGVELKVIPVSGIYSSYKDALTGEISFSSEEVGVTLQNIQARIRGNILMAFSNEFGKLLITTGNKSELAVGYCTLYGDMAGGLALISDVPKSDVYELAEYINRKGEIIPRSIIEREPSAELAPGQKDTDALPEYHLLDKVLNLYLEKHRTLEEIVSSGVDRSKAEWIINTVNSNEYKRRQMPPGIKVTSKAFGIGRRMPIAANF